MKAPRSTSLSRQVMAIDAKTGSNLLWPATALFNETDSECIPRRLAAGLAGEYKERLPYVKIPCGLCRRVLH
jgi:hypothetical protein